MKKIRMLQVCFSGPIYGHEITKFRGAILNELGKNDVLKKGLLFHNHLEEGKFRRSYPLIQYKRLGGKPQLVCFAEGVDQINLLFTKNKFNFQLGERSLETEVEDLRLKQHVLQVWDRNFRYRINNWLALNNKNYMEFKEIEDNAEQLKFLESILCGNIISMAKGLGWTVDKQVKIKIEAIDRMKKVNYKDTHLMSFDTVFNTNVSLPIRAGLGKGTSIGFGTLSGVRRTKKNETDAYINS